MCAGCFTGVEAAAINAAAGAVVARSGLARLRHRMNSLERRHTAYRANAEFLAGMGLDPERVLGPPPAAAPREAEEPAPVGGLPENGHG
jgi:hypothetical protein